MIETFFLMLNASNELEFDSDASMCMYYKATLLWQVSTF